MIEDLSNEDNNLNIAQTQKLKISISKKAQKPIKTLIFSIIIILIMSVIIFGTTFAILKWK